MAGSSLRWLLFPMLVAVATTVSAQNKCVATGQMGGQALSLTHCEVAFYEGSPELRHIQVDCFTCLKTGSPM